MPIKHLKRHVHRLRQEPEHVRIQAATLITAISGVFMVILWVTVLLPLQLHFIAKPSENQNKAPIVKTEISPSEAPLFGEVPQPTSQSRVSGVQDTYEPVATPVTSPVTPSNIISSESPVALPLDSSVSEPATPVQTQP